ncbi:MAG: hypothetical protein KJ626_08685 [Verrucomicrobia bacterium]|nr:hypothetical protein [Verrucomicrobiota bacterium]
MTLIYILNRICGHLSDALIYPFRTVSPWPALLASSLAFAAFSLFAFKYFSNQEKLRRAKSRLIAHILEIQLFKDDLWSIFATFGRILLAVCSYMKETLKPLLVLIIPMLLFLIQMSGWFEHAPLHAGSASRIELKLEEGWLSSGNTLHLRSSDGIEVESTPFIFPEDNEMIWRFTSAKGAHAEWLDIQTGDETARKKVVFGSRLTKIFPTSAQRAFWKSLMNPDEVLLPAEMPLESVSIAYPERTITLLGMKMHWIVALFIVSLLFGLILKYPMRVDF